MQHTKLQGHWPFGSRDEDFLMFLPYTVETELKVTQSALDVHMGCTPFVKDW